MKTADYRFPLALTFIDGIGSIKAKNLIAYLGSAQAVFEERKVVLSKVPGIRNIRFSKKNLQNALAKAEITLEQITKENHRIFYYLEDNYPRRLKQTEDGPVFLFGKGNFDSNPPRTVAVVGTRNATSYGKQICSNLITTLQNKQITVISGLAHGIDGITHQLCVKENIPTIGVLGHGLDRIYPAAHKRLAEKMLENGGLLTEYIPGTIPDSVNFPMRNRIVAGLADAVIIVESDTKGGSLITCELANDYNKDVFAFPGSVYSQYSRGCNRIIAESKAHLLTSPEQLLTYMGWTPEKKETGEQLALSEALDHNEQLIFELLREKEKLSLDAISVISQIPRAQLSSLLLKMELSGFLQALPGKRYQLGEKLLVRC